MIMPKWLLMEVKNDKFNGVLGTIETVAQTLLKCINME